MITGEKWGTSLLGETWYAEADHLMGPWVYARKIVTHDDYSFYNPKQHPMFDQDHGRVFFFEGTYTRTFSNTDVATPRYDYNQIMYRLTLSDERLFLPVPVYQLDGMGEDESQYQLKTSIYNDLCFMHSRWSTNPQTHRLISCRCIASRTDLAEPCATPSMKRRATSPGNVPKKPYAACGRIQSQLAFGDCERSAVLAENTTTRSRILLQCKPATVILNDGGHDHNFVNCSHGSLTRQRRSSE